MKQFRNLRSQLLRYATTALTVSLLVTLRVETPCSTPSGAATGYGPENPTRTPPGARTTAIVTPSMILVGGIIGSAPSVSAVA